MNNNYSFKFLYWLAFTSSLSSAGATMTLLALSSSFFVENPEGYASLTPEVISNLEKAQKDFAVINRTNPIMPVMVDAMLTFVPYIVYMVSRYLRKNEEVVDQSEFVKSDILNQVSEKIFANLKIFHKRFNDFKFVDSQEKEAVGFCLNELEEMVMDFEQGQTTLHDLQDADKMNRSLSEQLSLLEKAEIEEYKIKLLNQMNVTLGQISENIDKRYLPALLLYAQSVLQCVNAFEYGKTTKAHLKDVIYGIRELQKNIKNLRYLEEKSVNVMKNKLASDFETVVSKYNEMHFEARCEQVLCGSYLNQLKDRIAKFEVGVTTVGDLNKAIQLKNGIKSFLKLA